MRTGRPTLYTPELADKICEEIADGKSMRTICAQDGFPEMVTVFRWLRKHEDFCKQYVRAKDEQAEALIEDMIDIADDNHNDTITIKKGDKEIEIENREWVNRSRLRVDTRKWIASKLKPKKYGEKIIPVELLPENIDAKLTLIANAIEKSDTDTATVLPG